MIESEWLGCTDPTPMLEFLRGRVSDRKLRLFAVASCRRIWNLIPDEGSKDKLVASERFAEGVASRADFAAVRSSADQEALEDGDPDEWMAGITAHITDQSVKEAATPAVAAAWLTLWGEDDNSSVLSVALWVRRAATLVQVHSSAFSDDFRQADHWGTKMELIEAFDPTASCFASAEGEIQAHLTHDIFSNPFRPVSINSALFTPTILTLAQTAYEERILPSGELDPDRLAVLSDALEEAGCEDADILSHLRSSGPHVRGCWVLDLLLGKE